MPEVAVADRRRLHVRVSGLVQGVGFRPFVYRSAAELGLTGFVENNDRGVDIEVEGESSALESFLERMEGGAPPLASVAAVEARDVAVLGTNGFQIRDSGRHGAATTRISPDAAICDDCLRELFDPDDRRYRYPFINCTNCGPRYTIVEGIPYDRPLTSMKHFEMCPECVCEYHDPMDRRFHAQPNACPVCGPQVTLTDRHGNRVDTSDPFAKAQEILASGLILAVKGLGGFHLAVNPHDDVAVRRLRERKGRAEKPFALMARDLATVFRYCKVTSGEERALQHRARPIVLLEARGGTLPTVPLNEGAANPDGVGGSRGWSSITESECPPDAGPLASSRLGARKKDPDAPATAQSRPAPPYTGFAPLHEKAEQILLRERDTGSLASLGMTEIAFMLPYTPIHYLLLDGPLHALVMTSANLSEEPIAIGNEEAYERLGDIADYFMVHDRDILQRCDDSVVRVVDGEIVPIRRSRGFVPDPVPLPFDTLQTILACGGELKNTIGLARGDSVFLSQHIGDLDNPSAYRFFEAAIAHLQSILEIEPEVIAYDMHPEYLSTKWANDQKHLRPVAVQHHHAHLAAVMAENGVTDPTIGIILDGTGYGTDGTIWGGEVLVGDLADFERFAWLRPFALPGGTAAIKHPWRIAYALMQETLADQDHPFRRGGPEPNGLDLVWGNCWSVGLPGDVRKQSQFHYTRPEPAPRASACPNDGHPIAGPTAIPTWIRDRLLLFKTTAERESFDKVIRQRINTPMTSSCGRLFDGVSALLGLCDEVTYEGQAAIALEMAAEGRVPGGRHPGLDPGSSRDVAWNSAPASPEGTWDAPVSTFAGMTKNEGSGCVDEPAGDGVLGNQVTTPGFSPGPAAPNNDPRAGFNPRGIPGQNLLQTRSRARDDTPWIPASAGMTSRGSLDWTPILRSILEDLQNDVPISVIARSFHTSLADLFVNAAVLARKDTGINRVGLSGGVFQNLLLFDDIRTSLESQGFEVITHRLVPTNDGGLSYGQAVVAARRLQV